MNKLSISKDDLIKMYESGFSSREIAKHFGVSQGAILNHLKRYGVSLRSNRIELNVSSIEYMYLSELLSENEIACKLRVSRNVIRRVLEENSIPVRGQSEAEAVKWSKIPKHERINQVAAANEAVRNKPAEFHKANSVKQAIAKQKTLAKACDTEMLFIAEFKKLGHACTPQRAFGPYNIDIAIGNTAIEIHGNTCHPHTHTYYRQRVMNLLKGGWHVIYIKTTGKINAKLATDKVSRMIDLIKSDKSGVCHYGVIRGSGQLISTGCLDGDHIATVNASDGFFKGVE